MTFCICFCRLGFREAFSCPLNLTPASESGCSLKISFRAGGPKLFPTTESQKRYDNMFSHAGPSFSKRTNRCACSKLQPLYIWPMILRVVFFFSAQKRYVFLRYAGQMWLCDFGAPLDQCPDDPSCMGPGGTQASGTRGRGAFCDARVRASGASWPVKAFFQGFN